MPIIKSAKKRVRVAEKAAIRNSKTKRSLKAAVKDLTGALGSKKAAPALSKVQSEIDKAAKKGVMHKNKAARRKSKAALAAKKAAGVTKSSPVKAEKPAAPAAKKPAVKKPTTKVAKPAAKKAPAKATKPAVKKAPAKKPAAKKPAAKAK